MLFVIQVFLYTYGVYGTRVISAVLSVALLLYVKNRNILDKIKIPLLLCGPVVSALLVTALMAAAAEEVKIKLFLQEQLARSPPTLYKLGK